MKILMLTPYVPYPPNSGGQTRTFNLIKNLAKKHEITSFAFLRWDQPAPDLRELKKYVADIKLFGRKKSFASISKILKTGFSLHPYLVNMYKDDGVKAEIARELNNKKYDLIHVETYYIMPNVPKTSVPVLLAEQTIEYLVYQHFAETSPWWKLYPWWSLKPLLYVDVAKHKYWEQFYWKKAKKVVAMSEADKRKMLELVPGLDVDIVANGVDLKFFFKKTPVKKEKAKKFLFVGNFNWLQNREAAQILAKKIWPLIKATLPGSRLWIVGRGPTEEVNRLAASDIKVSGDIDDIRVAYQESDVLLAPLYGGGGTRYKIIEAMASDLPVVATEIGIEGLGAKNNIHALISNDLNRLADLSVTIATNETLKTKITKNARELVTKKYDWKIISEKLDKIYESTARKN